MECYELAGFRFHRIVEKPVCAESEVEDLGDWLSKATARPKKMRMVDAIALLKLFVNGACETEPRPAEAVCN